MAPIYKNSEEIKQAMRTAVLESSEKYEISLRELFLMNIDSKRSYLNNLITITLIAAGFTITIKDQLHYWALVFSVGLYLLAIICACGYLTALLTYEGKSLEKLKKFQKQSVKEMLNYIEQGNFKDAHEFIKNKGDEEAKFKKDKVRDVSDFWFWIINIFFISATILLLISFLLKQYNIIFCP